MNYNIKLPTIDNSEYLLNIRYDDNQYFTKINDSRESIIKEDRLVKLFKYLNLTGAAKYFNLDISIDFEIVDVNLNVICMTNLLKIHTDIYNGYMLCSVGNATYDFGIAVMCRKINDQYEIYCIDMKYVRQIYHNMITKDIFLQFKDIYINIYGNDLCKMSGLCTATTTRKYDKVYSNGHVAITGDILYGKNQKQNLFSNQYLDENGYKFVEKKTIKIEDIDWTEIKSILSPSWKNEFNGLYLCMQPNGEWWITASMEYSERYGWKHYDGGFFDLFETYIIEPVKDPSVKYYSYEN